MSPLLIHALVGVPWIVLVAYRIATASRSKDVKKREGAGVRAAVIANQVVAFTLLFGSTFRILPQGKQFLPDLPAIRIVGIALAWTGIGLVIWAQRHMGRFWSARITIKAGHQLIRTGPYVRVRHPIYSGLLLAVAGTTLATGEWRGLAAFLLILIAFGYKMRKEEALLTQTFGDAYLDYRKDSGYLFPYF